MADNAKGVRVRLDEADEYTHPVEDVVNFNESMYFNVFDRSRNIGGWFRLANRPNEGRGEMSCCVYLPDGRVGFMFARPACTNNDAFDSAGMKFEVIEPFKRLTKVYTIACFSCCRISSQSPGNNFDFDGGVLPNVF